MKKQIKKKCLIDHPADWGCAFCCEALKTRNFTNEEIAKAFQVMVKEKERGI